jgi:hypothetical protein
LNSNKFLPSPARVDVKQNKRRQDKFPAPVRTKRPRPLKSLLAAVLLRALGRMLICYRAWCNRLLRCWLALKVLGRAPKPQHRLAL